MTDTAMNRDPDACTLKACHIKEIDTYYVEATGASVTADSSVNLIYRYCGKLPGDKYEFVIFAKLSLIFVYAALYLCVLLAIIFWCAPEITKLPFIGSEYLIFFETRFGPMTFTIDFYRLDAS